VGIFDSAYSRTLWHSEKQRHPEVMNIDDIVHAKQAEPDFEELSKQFDEFVGVTVASVIVHNYTHESALRILDSEIVAESDVILSFFERWQSASAQGGPEGLEAADGITQELGEVMIASVSRTGQTLLERIVTQH
jgi:hypothetical protein